MLEATRLNFSVEIPSNLIEEAEIARYSKGAAAGKPKRKAGSTTLVKVVRHIEAQNIPSERKAELIQQAKNCPTGALVQFCQKMRR